jgi:signal transduction histidine kinase
MMDNRKLQDEADEAKEERLRALITEHESKLVEIAELVANVRHEINNPLTGVIGQAQLLLREELSPTARRRVETIEQLAGRIRDTVARLREVQRPHKTYGLENESEADAPPRH